ncbi:DUF3267 domain-containing protein [Mangrovibacterium sp.]|uniref:DUF3267 domain-containing protein n=1 Tax=Mangrovibacterium sp. TaxID=1961364 RepID=UPI00356584D7
MTPYTPDDFIDKPEFELLQVIDHRRIKTFIYDQLREPTRLMRIYGIYQVLMILLVGFLVGRAFILALDDEFEPLLYVGGALIFASTVLVVMHELIHALAYWMNGVRKLKAGAVWRKFIFYVAADRQVVDALVFLRVALAPFVLVKLICIIGVLWFWSLPVCYFFGSIMCIHSLFCAGDMAMLDFYQKHRGKEIFNFDDLKQGKTFFYFSKK